jgi:hypothetical protein
MSTFSDLLPPTKSDPRGAGIEWTPKSTEGGPPAGALVIKQRRGHTSYSVEEAASDEYGRSFVVAKLNAGGSVAEAYVAQLGAHGSRRCDCLGYRHNGECKHLAALAALVEAGRL